MATEYDRELRPEDHALARAEAAEQRVAELQRELSEADAHAGEWVQRAERLEAALRAVLDRWDDLSDTATRNLLEVALKGEQAD